MRIGYNIFIDPVHSILLHTHKIIIGHNPGPGHGLDRQRSYNDNGQWNGMWNVMEEGGGVGWGTKDLLFVTFVRQKLAGAVVNCSLQPEVYTPVSSVDLCYPCSCSTAQQFVLNIEAASPSWGSKVLKSIVILISEHIAYYCMTSQTQVWHLRTRDIRL